MAGGRAVKFETYPQKKLRWGEEEVQLEITSEKWIDGLILY